MSILALGPEGTFSHELAVRVFEKDIWLIPTIAEIFRMVEEGKSDAVVPLENSEAGGVGATLDGFLFHKVYITGELYMPVHHHLVSLLPLSDVRVIYAHPQTHEQCSRFLESTGIPVIHTSSNAASAREMLSSSESAAVVSRMAADIYRLPILCENIENNRGNTTRFVVISKTMKSSPGCTKCSILIDPEKDRAGLLHDLLGVFSDRNINLTRIESRPSKRGMGSYIFFIDIEYTPSCRDALSALRDKSEFRELGCYGRMEVPPWKYG